MSAIRTENLTKRFGALAAVEVIKLLTHLGTPLYGRMLAIDFAQGFARQVGLPGKVANGSD